MGVPSGLGAQFGAAAETYTNEVQSISGTASGTFGLSFGTYSGAASLSTTATAPQVQAYLEAFPNIGTGGVTCTGGPLPTAVSVTFVGAMVSGQNVAALAVTGATTGLTFTTTTAGKGYGDSTTPTRFVLFNKEGLKLDIVDNQVQAIGMGNQTDRSDLLTQTRRRVAGDWEMPFMTKGMGLFLDQVFGTSAITTPTNGVLTRRMRFTLGDQRNKSMTVQVGRPDATGGSSNVRPFTYTGTKLDGLELKLETDGALMATYSAVAQDESTSVTLATASLASGMKAFNAGNTITLTLNGVSLCAKDVTFKLDNKLKADREFLCSNLIGQPLNTDLRVATLECTVEFRDMAVYNMYTAGSVVPVSLSVRGDLIETVASPGPYYNQVDITGAACRVRTDGPVVEGPDILEMKVEVSYLYDGTNEPVILDWYTTDTAL